MKAHSQTDVSHTFNIQKPYAIIEKDGVVTRYDGDLHIFQTIAELRDFYRERISSVVFLTPFCTIRERGFESHGNEPILAIEATHITVGTKESIMEVLPNTDIVLEKPMTPLQSDGEFASIVSQIQSQEIAGGNICQMVLSQPYIGKIQDFSEVDALSIFHNCLKQKWQYMTVFVSDGQGQYFISLTPEQHLGVKAGEVTMDPIAGTIKKGDIDTLKPRLLEFLSDPKEKNELFQVLDEELKMMEVICANGGRIEGPFLRQNGAVIHTEYRLIGERDPSKNPLDMLRETLHAPTLVGGPVESAARLIHKYETVSRGYYGGEIGILTPDGNLDSAILIRMAHISEDGNVKIQAGAGITKKSTPLKEAEEVRAKTGGMQAAILGKMGVAQDVQSILEDAEITQVLAARNEGLSKFHFSHQSELLTCEKLVGKTVAIIDNEDNFTQMLARMMTRMGMDVTIIKNQDFDPVVDSADLVLIWPGPGDINDMNDPKMNRLAGCTKTLLENKRNVLGICLWHQSITRENGLKIEKMNKPRQWEQKDVDFFGESIEKMWFYNSFCPVYTVSNHSEFRFPETRNILSFRDKNVSGFQFHPESVMSENGYEILKNEILRIFGHSA